MPSAIPQVRGIAGFGLTSPAADRLTQFYERAFDARLITSERVGGAEFESRMGVHGGAQSQKLRLGDQAVDILQFDTPGSPYPGAVSPFDVTFQHFAIVVGDMNLAMAQLRRTPGWTPISRGGPQRLPQRSGGVSAFKFQDPDGHPLELLEFPREVMPPYWKARANGGVFLGIDHSAISVRDTAASTAFYAALDFHVSAQTLNHGTAQAQLDGIPAPTVEVTALTARESTPHLELLCYRGCAGRARACLASNDVAATRIVLTGDGGSRSGSGSGSGGSMLDAAHSLLVDPDGHHLLVSG